MTYSEIRKQMPSAVQTDIWYLVCSERHIHALLPRRGNMRLRRWTNIFDGSWGWSVYRFKNCGTDVVHEGYQGGGVRSSEPPAEYLRNVVIPEICA